MNMYANDNPAMHRQPGTLARGPYTNPQPPLHSQHMAGYAEPGSGHEQSPGGYQEAQYYHPISPGTVAPPSIEGDATHCADIPGTHSNGMSQPSEPLVRDAADK